MHILAGMALELNDSQLSAITPFLTKRVALKGRQFHQVMRDS